MNFNEKTPLLTATSCSKSFSARENEPSPSQAVFRVERPVYQIEEINTLSVYEHPSTNFAQTCRKTLNSCSPGSCLLNAIPVLKWLPQYKFSKNIAGDILSGITVAIMHIPHGMAYGLLGNLPPIVGIYMGFFPVLMYFIFGTSRHVSMGTVAIVCLMTGKAVSQHSSEEFLANGTAVPANNDPDNHMSYTSIQVATAVTFTVAAFQMLMYVFRLGIMTALLSETLVNSFTCASAFYVVIEQLKDLFGLELPKRKGMFRLVKVVYDVVVSLPEANVAALTISAVFISVMVLNNELLKPWLSRKTRIPFPIELLAVATGTAISYALNMHEKYGISIVGHIPTGFPQPDLPAFELIPYIALDAFVIMMVSYTTSMSLALILAQKQQYEIDANQEFFALSWSNLFGSFFSCMPITASLSRSMIQEAVGGVTQVASVVSCLILVVVLLWVGPVFENLPRCVLASIIVVALKNMLLQFTSLKRYWKLSKWDALVWLSTFFATTLIAIDIGLMTGILVSLLAIFVQAQRPSSHLLGVVPNTGLYLDIKSYKGTHEIDGIKIFRYIGCLNFASKATFKSMLLKKVDPAAVLPMKMKWKGNQLFPSQQEDVLLRCVILDFAAVTYVDPSGVEMLRQLVNDFKKLDIVLFLSACSSSVFETFKRCDTYEGKNSKFIIFPTIHDAVLYAQSTILNNKSTIS